MVIVSIFTGGNILVCSREKWKSGKVESLGTVMERAIKKIQLGHWQKYLFIWKGMSCKAWHSREGFQDADDALLLEL